MYTEINTEERESKVEKQSKRNRGTSTLFSRFKT